MLTDLDELMLTVRDPESRTYLREALISYRGGAYRAAIVSVWIAVVYDIISKIRVLASQGDKAAEATIQSLDNAIKNHDLKALLKIEDGMLDEARDKFEFVNRLEHEDLERIKQDRHRCAHPAFSSDTLLFSPTAETVRAHIVHAIAHLLRNPPVQGKAAIEKVVRDIASLSFPRNQSDVDKLMNLQYLDHARESLVSSIVSVLVKALLRKNAPILLGHEDASLMALVAVSRRHPAIYETRMQEELPKTGATLDDTTIPNIFPLLNVESRAWSWLDEATRMRAVGLVTNYVFGSGDDESILDALALEPLREPLLGQLRKLDPSERLAIIAKNPRAELIDDALTVFEESPNFRDAEPRGRIALLNMGSMFTMEQLRRALKAVPANYEIWNAARIPGILASFFDVVRPHFEQAKADWEQMMNSIMRNSSSSANRRSYKVLQDKLETAGLGPFDWEKVKAEVEAEQKAADAEHGWA
jgi:hypothetical protein